MPRRELRYPKQVEEWLVEMGEKVTISGRLILIGSGGLLWHAAHRGISEPLSESSMDVDPVTNSDEIAALCYNALIGSDFEAKHGWHVNLMPDSVLREFPPDWEISAAKKSYGLMEVIVPSPVNLLIPKLKRNEPRDRAHLAWAKRTHLVD